jgi:hypothetical protein
MGQSLDWDAAQKPVKVRNGVAAAAAAPRPGMLVVSPLRFVHSLVAVVKHKSMRNKINILLRRD